VLKQIAQIAGSPETVFTRLGRILEPEQWSASHDHWRRLLELLAAYGLHDEQFELVPVLARDWEYYSGLMFELYTADERHIAGGGRYDGFAQLIGSPVDIPAVGFTYYLDALLEGGTATPASSNSWSIVGEPADLSVVRWSQALRKHGFNIRVASDLPDEPLRQLIHADDQAILYDGVRYPFQDLPSLIEKLKDFTST
jgi:histidyl-tRNA synthetase